MSATPLSRPLTAATDASRQRAALGVVTSTGPSMTFRWRGVTDPNHPTQRALGNTKAKRRRGTLTLEGDKTTVGLWLRSQGIEPTRIEAKDDENVLQLIVGWFRRVKTEHRLAFYESMAFLDQVTTQKALQICAKRCRNERYATAILGVAHDFVNGVPLDEALARRPKEFSAIEVAMVRAGQRASEMKSTYSNIGQMLQNLYETETACWDALRGPGILSFFAVGGIWFMLAWFVPQMASLLTAVGGKMPAPTMFVLWLSGVAINPLVWLASAGLLVGAIWLWRWLMHDPSFALRVGNGIASIPKIGSLVQQFMTARVARALSVTGRALAAGKAVELIIPLARWRRYRMALEQIAKSIRDGREIEEAFAETNVFDPMLVQYLETGREAAALDAACERVADFLEREVQRSLKALTELIEPILTAVISAVFTVVVLALYLPYLDMLNDAMKMTNGVQ